jgi:hypothetical protein
MHGKAIHPPSLAVYHPATRWLNVTVTKLPCDCQPYAAAFASIYSRGRCAWRHKPIRGFPSRLALRIGQTCILGV